MKKYAVILFIGSMILVNILLFMSWDINPETTLDLTQVNDLTHTLADNWEKVEDGRAVFLKIEFEYVVFDNQGKVIAYSNRNKESTLDGIIKNRGTLIDIEKDGKILGKVGIENHLDLTLKEYEGKIRSQIGIYLLILSGLFFSYYVYLYKVILGPFDKLQVFAKKVAAGNLDFPLPMDKHHVFGAFSESFDLMREELARARENERKANQSKKELTASLSHDIKTPVASIRAVSELMMVKTEDLNQKQQLATIISKAEQINELITGLFHEALEDLKELKVNVTQESSLNLEEMIKSSDYENRILMEEVPPCLINIDPLRFSQVVDNIISNSYKYAGTDMEVTFFMENEFLCVTFTDYGEGVNQKELPLLFQKYYRAENAIGKNGAGLGLYLSKYFMEKMGGTIQCSCSEKGFSIIIRISLVFE